MNLLLPPDKALSSQTDVSIIIPVYNTSQASLTRCLESCINQSFKDKYEIILIDDASNLNETVKTIKSYKDKYSSLISVIRFSVNSGVSEARNKGMDLSRGKYIYFVDSDDYIGKESLERMFRYGTENNADIINSKYGKTNRWFPTYGDKLGNTPKASFIENEVVYITTVHRMFKLSYIRQLGLRFDENIKSAQDAVFMCRAIANTARICNLTDYDCYYMTADEKVHLSDYKPAINEFTYMLQKRVEAVFSGSLYKSQELNAFAAFQVAVLLKRFNRDLFQNINIETRVKNLSDFSKSIIGYLPKETDSYLMDNYKILLSAVRENNYKEVEQLLKEMKWSDRPLAMQNIDNNEIPIVFICDSTYAMVTSVAMTSIIKTKSDKTKLHFYIITTSLSEDAKQKLKSMQGSNVIIEVLTASIEEYKDMYAANGYRNATHAALLKFDIARLLPSSIKKAVYLDGDVIVRKDLNTLYNKELRNVYAAAVIDSGKLYSKREYIVSKDTYFNTGVMVFNLDKIRRENIREKLIAEKIRNHDTPLMDQDIFNVIFGDNVLLLPLTYNFLYINLHRAAKDKKFTFEQLNKMYSVNFNDLKEIEREATVVHLASQDKPWLFYDVTFNDKWYKYYLLSPYGSQPLSRTSVKVSEYEKLLEQEKKKNIQLNIEIESLKSKLSRPLSHAEINSVNTVLSKPWANTKPRDKKIIVSLTSYSKRIAYVPAVIDRVMQQTVKPDRIVLYLANEERNLLLPKRLLEQQQLGIEIYYVHDLKPHKKYFFAMKDNPDDLIITLDDDLDYRYDLIEILYNSYLNSPNAVSAVRIHKMTFDDYDALQPYRMWRLQYDAEPGDMSMLFFATGGAGTLYPPGCLHNYAFDEAGIEKTCIFADDLWLKVMQVLNGTPVVLASRKRKLEYLGESQEDGLYKLNVFNNHNDKQLDAILRYLFGSNINNNLFMIRLKEENYKQDKFKINERNILSGAI